MSLSSDSLSDQAVRDGRPKGSYPDRSQPNEKLGSGDVFQASEHSTHVVLLHSEKHAGKVAALTILGNAYVARFHRLGKVSDIDKAIDYQSQAVYLTSGNPVEQPICLSNLGISYMSRFNRIGELEDIDRAIQSQRQAAQLTLDGHADKPTWLANLGNSYISRYRRLREIADLEKAMECQSQAVLLTPDGSPSKPSLLNNLGGSYCARFQCFGELADCNSAIRRYEQALFLTPDGHANRPGQLNNLGTAYTIRSTKSHDIADVDKAIDYATQALLLTPEDHVDKPVWIVNISRAYRARFDLKGEIADIDISIDYQSQAALLTPDNYATKSGNLEDLGRSYLMRFKHLGKASDLEAANLSFERAAKSVLGDPHIRLIAAHQWAESSDQLGISPLPAYQKIFELVPKHAGLGRTITQRYKSLIQIGDVAMKAAASAISLQLFDCALEWLEQGRSVVWNQILQLRNSFDDLFEADPELAERLKTLGHALEDAGSWSATPASSLADMSDQEQDAQALRRLAAEWNNYIEQARLIPGFENFMHPRKANELRHAAKGGPVVVINVHSSRCDALIVLPNSDLVAHVPLENFSPTKAVEARAQLLHMIEHRGARDGGFKRARPVQKPEDMFRVMLATIWSDVVKPILDFLGYTVSTISIMPGDYAYGHVKRKPLRDELPHVTWCTTGALSFLPLHAAGFYDGSQPNAYDLVVSSYTPTLSALLTPPPPITQPHSGILAVGQESTKGLCNLPNTVLELVAIREHTKGAQYLQLDGENATVKAVLDAMDAYSWVHLACHASQNRSDPARSAFHLHDGDLLLSDITKRSFKDKGLAFLSACQTAAGDTTLPDEAVHLAAGMLMAGYPSVIATMWAINDEDAPKVAQQVYGELLRDGEMDHTKACQALHKAVAVLRETVGEKAFQQWVPFIHIGS